ncbi:inner membrane efflux protein [Bacillus sp. JCM 19047]|nr:inner membrane efflux protein [Bacillus sp. JCM 19047]
MKYVFHCPFRLPTLINFKYKYYLILISIKCLLQIAQQTWQNKYLFLLMKILWWGSVFLINVPIVAFALLFTILLVPKSKINREIKWDPLSSIQILIGLTALVYGIKEFAKEGGMVIGLLWLLISVVILIKFTIRQKKLAKPLLDVKLFSNTPFTSGIVTALVVMFVLIGIQLVFTQQLQLIEGISLSQKFHSQDLGKVEKAWKIFWRGIKEYS